MANIGKPAPFIKNSNDFTLPSYFKEVLQTLFDDVHRIDLIQKYADGIGGGSVFLVDLISENKQMPAVVKLGSKDLIDQELQAYEAYIKKHLRTFITRIEKHCFSVDQKWGGLYYGLVGDGILKFVNFIEYCKSTEISTAQILQTLEKYLFPVLKMLHQSYSVTPLLMRGSYDAMLPVNYVIAPEDEVLVAAPQGDNRYFELTPDTLDGELRKEQLVVIKKFRVTEIAFKEIERGHEALSITLNTPYESFTQPSFRIRFEQAYKLQEYERGREIPQIKGKITQTRKDFLDAKINEVFGERVKYTDVTHGMILFNTNTHPHKLLLPNPLLHIERILQKVAKEKLARVGTIHGDLNGHNILIFLDNGMPNIIDFAAARKDHLLHDFLKLETGIITELLPGMISDCTQLHRFYQNLHQVCIEQREANDKDWEIPIFEKPFRILEAVRKAAQQSFANRDDWTEYYECLVIYLLGSLKYQNLDKIPFAKECAVVGAASLLALTVTPLVRVLDTELVIPQAARKNMDDIIQAGRRHKIDGLTIVFLQLDALRGTEIWVKGAGGGSRLVTISAEQSGQITLSGWNPDADPFMPQVDDVRTRWPYNFHRWKVARIEKRETFLVLFAQPQIVAVWWIEHIATAENRIDRFSDRFLIIIRK